MLISKKSRRKSDTFESRFRTGEGADFPLRQYLRCREELIAQFVQGLLLLVFAVTLALFARPLNALFERHGADLSPLWRWMALGALFLFIVSVLRRLYGRVTEIREIRREMARLKDEFSSSEP